MMIISKNVRIWIQKSMKPKEMADGKKVEFFWHDVYGFSFTEDDLLFAIQKCETLDKKNPDWNHRIIKSTEILEVLK